MHLSAAPIARLRALWRDSSGVALTEFALSLPLLMTAGLWGIETANLAVTTLRVNQVAIQIADNASRIGDTSSLEDRRIYESDINDLLLGSNIQAGQSIDLYNHGRTIVSSLEVAPGTDDQQYIHWQRCKGTKAHMSSSGVQGRRGIDYACRNGSAGRGSDGAARRGGDFRRGQL